MGAYNTFSGFCRYFSLVLVWNWFGLGGNKKMPPEINPTAFKGGDLLCGFGLAVTTIHLSMPGVRNSRQRFIGV